jgi:hypothetical protein
MTWMGHAMLNVSATFHHCRDCSDDKVRYVKGGGLSFGAMEWWAMSGEMNHSCEVM